jgi:hypothetical protein
VPLLNEKLCLGEKDFVFISFVRTHVTDVALLIVCESVGNSGIIY